MLIADNMFKNVLMMSWYTKGLLALAQAVMATRLGAHMQGLGAMPAHTGAPALANLLQALQAALESCSSAAASPTPHAASNGLQRLYAGLLQQALALLLDGAAASFAALPVIAVADGWLSEPLNKHLLLHLLGQVGHLASSHLEDTICKMVFLQMQSRIFYFMHKI